jgi:hypothetical protein
MEHRVKKPVDYKVLNTKGKVDDYFYISTEIRYDNVIFIPLGKSSHKKKPTKTAFYSLVLFHKYISHVF